MCRGIHWPSYGPVDPCQIKILWTQKSSLPAHSSILAHSRLCSVIHVQSVSQDRSAFLWVRCVQSEDAYMPFCISARPCYLLCSQLGSVVVILNRNKLFSMHLCNIQFLCCSHTWTHFTKHTQIIWLTVLKLISDFRMFLLIPLLLLVQGANCGHFLFWLPMRFVVVLQNQQALRFQCQEY